jgi:hypothetical protein
MIDKHIVLVEFGFNSFNATCDFNTKTCFSIFLILWIEMFEMNDIIVKKTQGKHQVEQWFVGIEKKFI